MSDQQVAEAAAALVNPTTDSATRHAASQFLEQWNQTPEAWPIFVSWLEGFSQHSAHSELSVQLLCLQLLQSKIRREISFSSTLDSSYLLAIQRALNHQLMHSSPLVVSFASVCLAALAVRSQEIKVCVQQCQQSSNQVISLQILRNIPLELEKCCDSNTTKIILWPLVEPVLDLIRESLWKETALAGDTLKNWIKTCRIGLSHLNTPIYGGTESIMPVIVHVLSSTQINSERIIVSVVQALTESVLIHTDSGAETRSSTCQQLVHAISSGFLAAPMQTAIANGWHEASHYLAILVSTFIIEEVEDIVTEPAEALLHLLLQILGHPYPKTRMAALECLLTVQEISTSQRHEHWKAPLFRKAVEIIHEKVRFPSNFQDWKDEVEVDEDEFVEFRRLVKDVLVSSYFLLRFEMVNSLAQTILTASNWTDQEASLFCLTSIAREVSARVKSNGGGSTLSHDRTQTGQLLLHLAEKLSSTDLPQQKYLLGAVVLFIGAYAPTWATQCHPDAVLHMLTYLRRSLVIVPVHAAKSIRSLLVGCSPVLLSTSAIVAQLQTIMETALDTDNEDAMVSVTEGCTRLCMLIKEVDMSRHAVSQVIGPMVKHGESILQALSPEGVDLYQQDLLMVESLGRILQCFQTMIRFFDSESPAVSDMMHSIWPFIESVSQTVVQSRFEIILNHVMGVHQQLIKSLPEVTHPYFDRTMKYVVTVYQKLRNASSLDYMTSAVEIYGSTSPDSFLDLLNHISEATLSYFSNGNTMQGNIVLISAFYQLNQRYLLFCTSELLRCRQFSSIVSGAMHCLNICKGERESNRATLNFLAQLFGWRFLRLPPESHSALQNSQQAVDEQLAKHGSNLLHICFSTLIGGSQMLWPVCTECIFTIVATCVTWPIPESPDSNVSCSWLESFHPESQKELYHQVVTILLDLSRDGSKNKAKAKMVLTDFSKICRGELTTDALLTYSLS